MKKRSGLSHLKNNCKKLFRIKIFARGRGHDLRGAILPAGAVPTGRVVLGQLVRELLREVGELELVAELDGRAEDEEELQDGRLEFGHLDVDSRHRD